MATCNTPLPQAKRPEITPAHQLEEEVLKLSGLELFRDLHIFDVPITFDGENYIHTYKCGDQNKEVLVLIHGYISSSLLFYPMLKDLSQRYHVFCIDLLGMGLSSRSEFKCTTTEETIDYFVDSIEKWRETLDIKSFHLVAHSFGGFMGVHYALRYKNRVKRMFLLSPAGITKFEKEITPEEFAKNLTWFQRQIFYFVVGFYENKITPNEWFRSHSVLGRVILRQYVNRQFNGNGKEERLAKLLYQYLSALLDLKAGSDRSVFFILKAPKATAIAPLEDAIMQELNIPTVCYYGDRDWMNKAGAHRIEQVKGEKFKVKLVENCGHQLTMQNPKAIVDDILAELMQSSN